MSETRRKKKPALSVRLFSKALCAPLRLLVADHARRAFLGVGARACLDALCADLFLASLNGYRTPDTSYLSHLPPMERAALWRAASKVFQDLGEDLRRGAWHGAKVEKALLREEAGQLALFPEGEGSVA
jgi:hypothetical protein